jgi:hypothetical protein
MKKVLFFICHFAICQLALSQSQQSLLGRQLALGPEINSFDYREGELMNLKGTMLGAHLEFANKFKNSSSLWAFRSAFSFKQGQTNYEGSKRNASGFGSTPYSFNNNQISILQWDGYAGRFFRIEGTNLIIVPMLGLAYYSLFDADDPDPNDYSREQKYLTTPLRVEARMQLEGAQDHGITFFASYHPEATFRGENLTAGQYKYEQKKGSGKTVGINYQWQQYRLELEYESWEVDTSSTASMTNTNSAGLVAQSSSYEPANETKMLAVKFSYLF